AFVEANHQVQARRGRAGQGDDAAGCGRRAGPGAGAAPAGAAGGHLQPRGSHPRRTWGALRTGGRRLNSSSVLPFDASRRLTGPNLFFAATGVQLETAGIAVDELLFAGWRARIARARAHLGWLEQGLAVRRHRGGASLVLQAPSDQLFVATEV